MPLQPGSTYEFAHAHTGHKIGVFSVEEPNPGSGDVELEFLVERSSPPRYLQGSSDGRADLNGDDYSRKRSTTRFTPVYHSHESAEGHQVTVSLLSCGMAGDVEARKHTLGTYLGYIGGVLVSNAGLGPDSTFIARLNKSNPNSDGEVARAKVDQSPAHDTGAFDAQAMLV